MARQLNLQIIRMRDESCQIAWLQKLLAGYRFARRNKCLSPQLRWKPVPLPQTLDERAVKRRARGRDEACFGIPFHYRYFRGHSANYTKFWPTLECRSYKLWPSDQARTFSYCAPSYPFRAKSGHSPARPRHGFPLFLGMTDAVRAKT